MTEEIEFYSRASGTSGKKEDWYSLVVPDDGTDPFVEHAWAYHDADGDTKFNGSSSIAVSDFLSKEYPEDAKMSLRWLLTAKSAGSPDEGTKRREVPRRCCRICD